MACSTRSSARKVRSITAPLRTFFSLVRTKAPPLPGLTCWNSTTVKRPSGRLRPMPFFRSLVETAMYVLCEAGQGPGSVLGHHQGVFYADATDAREVDTGLDGDNETGGEDSSAQLRDRWSFVDIEAHSVTCAVLEPVRPTGLSDDG